MLALPLAAASMVVLGCAGTAEEDPDRGKPGRAEFLLHCSACHGRKGVGAQNLFPPLAGSPWVQATPELPIRIVLHGLEGRLEVGGEEYMNLMPPLGKRMNDEMIARVLTYVRGAWGNTAGPVAPGEVARVRAMTEGRVKPYQVSDLLHLLEGNAGEAGSPAAGEGGS